MGAAAGGSFGRVRPPLSPPPPPWHSRPWCRCLCHAQAGRGCVEWPSRQRAKPTLTARPDASCHAVGGGEGEAGREAPTCADGRAPSAPPPSRLLAVASRLLAVIVSPPRTPLPPLMHPLSSCLGHRVNPWTTAPPGRAATSSPPSRDGRSGQPKTGRVAHGDGKGREKRKQKNGHRSQRPSSMDDRRSCPLQTRRKQRHRLPEGATDAAAAGARGSGRVRLSRRGSASADDGCGCRDHSANLVTRHLWLGGSRMAQACPIGNRPGPSI